MTRRRPTYVLDTSVVLDYGLGVAGVDELVEECCRGGLNVARPVVFELACAPGEETSIERRLVRQALRGAHCIETTADAWARAAHIYAMAGERGVSFSAADVCDMLIYVGAESVDGTLVTSDAKFADRLRACWPKARLKLFRKTAPTRRRR